MKLGAQLFSIRTHLQNAEDLRKSFLRIKEIGYENVQLSGAAAMPAEIIRDVSEESGLPIVCTHVSFDRLTKDTDTVIEDHKIFGCPVIGLGSIPMEFRRTREGLESFLAQMEEPVKRIRDAGLSFAYHNHAFELEPFVDGSEGIAYDMMLERLDWNFIMDTYWVEFAGKSAVDYIAKIGGDRLHNIHFKDMGNDEKRSICPCGNGTLDFEEIFAACQRVGVKNVLVEQDNAVESLDAFADMETSFKNLRSIVH